jgi:uncharacterized 2Fe-2S/4Fe-4S cluster protein (DUF4445 family)
MKTHRNSHTVHFTDFNTYVDIFEGETVLQGARRKGLHIAGACSGRGACNSCAVKVVSGNVAFAVEQTDTTTGNQPATEWVRACQVTPLSDCTVKIDSRALAAAVRFEAKECRSAITYAVQPVVKMYPVELVPASCDDSAADMERIIASLDNGTITHFDLGALKTMPSMLRGHEWRLGIGVRNGECIGCRPPARPLLGLAVDLGSTNVAAFLINLQSGRLLANIGIENPQGIYGADVISRISHAVRTPDGGAELKTASVAVLNTIVKDLCAVVSAAPEDIVDSALCGNTAMHHLLLGLPVSQLGHAPFIPALTDAMDVKARDIGLHILEGAYMHLLPSVGGFVGGDHVAALLATEAIWSTVAGCILIDIGTNTEISLIHQGKIMTASTASGPALEGGQLSRGMRAAEGAIERVRLDGDTIACQVMGGGEPVGLCGSGVIDAVAVLVKAGIIDKRGYIRPNQRLVRDNGGMTEVVLTENVSFTQEDVRAVQLAKAAIRTGIDLLLRESGLDEASLECVVVAGAFGTVIDVSNAITIGMFPALPLERFRQVGNAAGTGIGMALVSTEVREQARRLAKRCRHCELNNLQGFQKTFMSRIGFN